MEKELIYAGADCVMDINSTIEEVDLQIFHWHDEIINKNNSKAIRNDD